MIVDIEEEFQKVTIQQELLKQEEQKLRHETNEAKSVMEEC